MGKIKDMEILREKRTRHTLRPFPPFLYFLGFPGILPLPPSAKVSTAADAKEGKGGGAFNAGPHPVCERTPLGKGIELQTQTNPPDEHDAQIPKNKKDRRCYSPKINPPTAGLFC